MDPRSARITTVFDALDTNSNGYLERDDFERLGRRIIHSLGVEETSPKAQTLLSTCFGYWEGLVGQLDRDGDGRLDCEEYARFHEPSAYQGSVRPYANALVGVSDRNDDGFVEHPDFVNALKAVGFRPENIEVLFRALDPGGTGRVPAHEWRVAIEEYFLAAHGETVGQTLV